MARLGLIALFTVSILTACNEPASEAPSDTSPSRLASLCDTLAARQVVERFGERMKQVPLLAPDSVVGSELRDAYAPFVTPDLLEIWVAEPARAPGRQVSSPWPERIEVVSVDSTGPGRCRVEGEVVYVTSQESVEGGEASRERVTLELAGNGQWRISGYEVAPTAPSDSASVPSTSISGVAEAVDILRRYYAAINARDFHAAYALWGAEGEASGQTFEEFTDGFAETRRVEVVIGAPGRVEPAAGSRYVEVPVEIRAVTESGVEQEFEGTYTLRRSVVDGASAEQRRWHLYSATLRPIP